MWLRGNRHGYIQADGSAPMAHIYPAGEHTLSIATPTYVGRRNDAIHGMTCRPEKLG